MWECQGAKDDFGGGKTDSIVTTFLYFLDTDGRVQKRKMFELWSTLAVYPDCMIGPARIRIKNQ
jgi:hypothetical protein